MLQDTDPFWLQVEAEKELMEHGSRHSTKRGRRRQGNVCSLWVRGQRAPVELCDV